MRYSRAMASLRFETGDTFANHAAISAALQPLGIGVAAWPTGNAPKLVELLAKPALSHVEKEQVLEHLEHYFERLRTDRGYQARDLIGVHRGRLACGIAKPASLSQCPSSPVACCCIWSSRQRPC